MEGLQAGSAQGPSDFQKDSGPLSVLRAVPLGANGPGAPGQECTFPLIYSPAHPGLSSTGGGLRSSPPAPSQLLHPPSSLPLSSVLAPQGAGT